MLTLQDSLYPTRYTKPLGDLAGWLTAYGVDTMTVAQVDSVVSSHTDGAGSPEREVFYAVKFYERTGFVFATRVQSGWHDAVAVQYIAASIKGVENFGRTGGPQREGRSPYVRAILAMPDPGNIGFPIAIIGVVSPPEYELLALIPQDGAEFEQFHCADGRVLHVAHSSRRFTGVGPILTAMANGVCKHEVTHRASDVGVAYKPNGLAAPHFRTHQQTLRRIDCGSPTSPDSTHVGNVLGRALSTDESGGATVTFTIARGRMGGITLVHASGTVMLDRAIRAAVETSRGALRAFNGAWTCTVETIARTQ